MNKVLVSVIVPIYNVEKYVERCVQSIMEQDYEHIEIILVDDGSSDGSGDIINRMALQDSRIRVIHEKNMGVSAARNSGMEIATGEYIVFVDGDDYIEKDCVRYFLDLILDNGCEMAVGENIYNIYETKQVLQDKIEILDALEVIEKIYLGDIEVAVWNKIYKKSFLDRNRICFNTSLWYGEGMLFNIESLQWVDKVAVGKKRVYHQVYNPGSATRDFNIESNLCGIKSMEYQKESWIKSNKKIESAWEYHYKAIYMSILRGLIKTNTVNEHKNLYKKCKRIYRSNWIKIFSMNISLKQKIYVILTVALPALMAKRFIRKEKYIMENRK